MWPNQTGSLAKSLPKVLTLSCKTCHTNNLPSWKFEVSIFHTKEKTKLLARRKMNKLRKKKTLWTNKNPKGKHPHKDKSQDIHCLPTDQTGYENPKKKKGKTPTWKGTTLLKDPIKMMAYQTALNERSLYLLK